jgi:hypothetical protein
MQIELWPIERVKPYHRNPRINDGPAVDAVAASLTEFGWRQPIVVDKDGLELSDPAGADRPHGTFDDLHQLVVHSVAPKIPPMTRTNC